MTDSGDLVVSDSDMLTSYYLIMRYRYASIRPFGLQANADIVSQAAAIANSKATYDVHSSPASSARTPSRSAGSASASSSSSVARARKRIRVWKYDDRSPTYIARSSAPHFGLEDKSDSGGWVRRDESGVFTEERLYNAIRNGNSAASFFGKGKRRVKGRTKLDI